MPTRQLAWLIAITTLSSGCSVIKETTHNVVVKPLKYHLYTDDFVTSLKARRLAKEAWQEIAGRDPLATHSEDYVDGFEAGFAEYLEFGGTGVPPPVPPRKYWKIQYQTPAGHQAIEDWYAGYSLGSTTAQASGLRDLFVVPTADPYVPDRVQWLRESRRLGASPAGGPGVERLAKPPRPAASPNEAPPPGAPDAPESGPRTVPANRNP